MFIGRLMNTFFALAYALSPNVYGIYVSQLLAGLATPSITSPTSHTLLTQLRTGGPP